MLGFKSFGSASATLGGIEVANMIRKGQLTPGLCPFPQFAAVAAWLREIVALHPAVSEVWGRSRRVKRLDCVTRAGHQLIKVNDRASHRFGPGRDQEGDPAITALWPRFAEQADKERWRAARLLSALVEHELAERDGRRVERHIPQARLLHGKILDTFDFIAVPTLFKAHINSIISGQGNRV